MTSTATNPESSVIAKINALELGGFASMDDLVDWQMHASPAAVSEACKPRPRWRITHWGGNLNATLRPPASDLSRAAVHHINGDLADNRAENIALICDRCTCMGYQENTIES